MTVVVVGAYGVGRTYRVERFPEAGETLIAIDSDDTHGGKGSNQAVAMARLGERVELFTALGDDAAAADARALWDAEGVGHAHVVTKAGPTMNGVIFVDASGENRIVISSGALSGLRPDDLEAIRPVIESADLVVVSLEIPLDVAMRALELAHNAGVRTLLNPAPAVAIPAEQLAVVDFITPNQGETSLLVGAPDDETALELLRGVTSSTIVQTRGANGALVIAPDGARTAIPAVVAARVVDTTGAGDSFTAALGVALAAGHDVADAAAWAAAAGAYTVQTDGVVAALPFADDLPPLDLSRSPVAGGIRS